MNKDHPNWNPSWSAFICGSDLLLSTKPTALDGPPSTGLLSCDLHSGYWRSHAPRGKAGLQRRIVPDPNAAIHPVPGSAQHRLLDPSGLLQ
jgi:hypothetical protein